MCAHMENLVPIGRFAQAARLSQKALRHYDATGLLEPAWVDPETGYRWYRVEQLRRARTIALLRLAGMPLTEIRSFLMAPSADAVDAFADGLRRELRDRTEVLAYVKRLLEEAPMFDVSTKEMAAVRFRSRTGSVRTAAFDAFAAAAIDELGPPERGAVPFTIYHGRVNEEEDGPVEVCLSCADGDRHLPAVEVAFTIAAGADCDFPAILGAYDAVARWAHENGRKLGGPPRELYLDGRLERTRMEVAWPLRGGSDG